MTWESLGRIAETLASRLSDNQTRFLVLFLVVLGAVVSQTVAEDPAVTVVVIAMSSMILLFGLLRPNNVPRGWKAYWTFILMISYVFVAVVIIGYAFYRTGGDIDISRDYQNSWQDTYALKVGEYYRIVESISEAAENGEVALNQIAERITSDQNFKTHVISTANFLEEWEICRETRCRMAEIHEQFDRRIFDFWANYRCFIAGLRRANSGYGRDFARRVQQRYETNQFVLGAREALSIEEGSLRVCRNTGESGSVTPS